VNSLPQKGHIILSNIAQTTIVNHEQLTFVAFKNFFEPKKRDILGEISPMV
jgi:hypothetical protein